MTGQTYIIIFLYVLCLLFTSYSTLSNVRIRTYVCSRMSTEVGRMERAHGPRPCIAMAGRHGVWAACGQNTKRKGKGIIREQALRMLERPECVRAARALYRHTRYRSCPVCQTCWRRPRRLSGAVSSRPSCRPPACCRYARCCR